MAPDQHDVIARLAGRLDELAVLTDLDGTLAAIRPRPEDVTIIDGGRETLAKLARHTPVVAVVSGRGIDDLMGIVGVSEIAYAGNHGMEFRHPGQDPAPDPEAARHRPTIDRFVERWEREFVEHDVAVEDKGVTISLHYRRSRDPATAEGFLHDVVQSSAREMGLVPTRGRMVLEIRPPVELNKGTAARRLVADAGARCALFMGDDHTDVDAMAALRTIADAGQLEEAVSVGVRGDEVPAEVVEGADIVVDGPEGALDLLRELLPQGDGCAQGS